MLINMAWRGDVSNDELNALHAEAFETRLFTAEEWNWKSQRSDRVWAG
jgi:hypothetical protein